MLFYRLCISAMSNKLNDVSAQNGTTLVLGAGAFSRYTRRAKCIAGIAEDETNTSSLGGQVCSRSTPVDPNACFPNAQGCSHSTPVCALARRLSIQMRLPNAQACSRSTPVCDRARRLSLQMPFPHVQACSRSRPVCALARRLCIKMRLPYA